MIIEGGTGCLSCGFFDRDCNVCYFDDIDDCPCHKVDNAHDPEMDLDE